MTGTLLPNGEVLATGGAEGNNEARNVAYAAEIWNPGTGQWRTGASMKVPRLDHSAALLLPDGRRKRRAHSGPIARTSYPARTTPAQAWVQWGEAW